MHKKRARIVTLHLFMPCQLQTHALMQSIVKDSFMTAAPPKQSIVNAMLYDGVEIKLDSLKWTPFCQRWSRLMACTQSLFEWGQEWFYQEVKNGVIICAWQKLKASPRGPLPSRWPQGGLVLEHPLTLWDHTSTAAAGIKPPLSSQW